MVAEGVEDKAAWQRLQAFGCDEIQGYVVSRPLPAPELVTMRGAYGQAFTQALSSAFGKLEVPERTLLRQYFLDGLTIDVLAELYQIHRATAARRVAAARERLVDSVRAKLKEVLGIGDHSVDEIITLSNLDESLGTLLRRTH